VGKSLVFELISYPILLYINELIPNPILLFSCNAFHVNTTKKGCLFIKRRGPHNAYS